MEESILEAIKNRHSVRAYLERIVPDDVIEQILVAALQSPSWANTQPWEVAVVREPLLGEIKKALLKAVDDGRPPVPDFPFPTSWPEANQDRSFENGERMYRTMGISRDEKGTREGFGRMGFEFFGAPQAIFLFLHEGLSSWSLFDLGLFTQSLLLAAHSFGLGTCPMTMVTIYPDIVRKVLGVPANRKLALGIPIGYPDMGANINQHRSSRVSLDEAVRWYR